MATETGLWRATYTPGSWVVLSGPTSMVIMQPAPAKASSMINKIWDVVVAADSIEQLAEQLAGFRLDQMPNLATLFWAGGTMRSLTRGKIKIVDIDSGRTVADGEGIFTWSETDLREVRRVRLDLEPVDDQAMLQLPLVVGAVTASAIVVDGSDEARVSSPQQSQPDDRPRRAAAEYLGAGSPHAAARPGVDELAERRRNLEEQVASLFSAESEQRSAAPAGPREEPPAPYAAPRPEEPRPAEPSAPVAGVAPGSAYPGSYPAQPSQSAQPAYAGPGTPGAQAAAAPGIPASSTPGVQPQLPGAQAPAASGMPAGQGGQAEFGSSAYAGPGAPGTAPAGVPSAEPAGQIPGAAAPPMGATLHVPGTPAGGYPAGGQPGPAQAGAPNYQVAASTDPWSPSSQAVAPADSDVSMVPAMLCPQRHPNPPDAGRCRRCGAPLQGAPQQVSRPVLAVLRPSSGQVVEVDRSVLIGRSPTATRVAREQLPKLLTVPSPSHDISRTHVKVAPEGWDLVATDLHSTNGTALVRPGRGDRETMAPGEPVAVYPGCVLDLGDGVTILIDNPA